MKKTEPAPLSIIPDGRPSLTINPGSTTEHGGSGVPASSTSPALQEPRMHVGQVQCTADGAVRLYATFSNNTNLWGVQ